MIAIVVGLLLVVCAGALTARRIVGRYRDALAAARSEARHDGLTGVLTRSAFGRELERRIARVDAEHEIALLAIDVDGFGQLNKQRGHAVGDELLIHLARTLRHCTRAEDLVGRLGGDEFAVVLAAGDPVAVGERILAALGSRGVNHRGIKASTGSPARPRTAPPRPLCCASPTSRCGVRSGPARAA